MAFPSSFDPNDPRLQLPDPSQPPAVKPPVPPGRPGDGPGWGNRILLIASIVGMAVFSPILLKLNHLSEDDNVFTAAIILPVLGFFFSLVVFAGVVGVRVVHWIAEWFVDMIFGAHGSGYVADDTWPKPDSEDDPDRGSGTSKSTGR